ncbi:glycoside hydrolase family 127 protein [Chitinophaga niabensis]|uniref:DUF1680 family protein n=1 Tax=Chitinophaga niabensis TaxID=536979 RepID=A0A1N6K707_9BACT|nr:beta-L-arabinofuranosidase domain-containing protein [Chitinophaga niabensis]SIO52331.1 hypothetical protein SAMN04488055_5211 [Chitinophaga niabensis]
MKLFLLLASAFVLRTGPVDDQLKPASSVRIAGFTGERLDASYNNRILAQDVDRLIETFKTRTETRCWQTEFWGKWFTSAVLAYRYKPEPQLKAVLDHAVTGIISTQTEDGYIGNYAEANRLQAWDIWGRKYVMLGLLDYYDLTGDKKSLAAAGKVADHLMRELEKKNVLIVKMGNHRGMAATSVLEPVCRLYARTKNKKYLAFAEEIIKEWETPQGPQLISKSEIDVAKRFPKAVNNWYGWDQGQKAYEMMSCYEGLLEYYRLTGEEKYKQAVVQTWENIRNTEINVAGSGSALECWFGGAHLQTSPIHHYQETCVTATWIKLSQQLLRLTGEAKYADAIEQTYYNALLGSMSTDGAAWAKYTPLYGQRLKGSEQCGMGLNCCEASGPRGLFTLPLTVAMSGKDGLSVNFFTEGEFVLRSPSGQQVILQQHTDYPVSGKIAIGIQLAKTEEMTLRIRIPAWSEISTLTVNGAPVANVTPGTYATIKRKWAKGDALALELDMRGRVETSGTTPKYVAIFRGPVLLARDARLPGPDFGAIVKPIADKDKRIALTLKDVNKNGIWMQFDAMCMPESYAEGGTKPVPLSLCDYASAGNAASLPMFRVWMPQLLDPKEL